MQLIPWRERGDLLTFRSEFDKLFDSFFSNGGRFEHLPEAFRRGPIPAVNMAETEKDFLVSVELPGLDEKEIQVQLLGSELVISGERKWEGEKKDKTYHRVESQYGSFRRIVEMPEGAKCDPDAIAATYSKGVLEIRVPKVEPKPAAKIAVKAK
ncbi:MAG: Hsp20/alpha crystallin family protein [Planctomycetes bacterium]|nr:Hsp20/alpha crystallin family protein [Planctomycetota bacterium]